MAKFWAHGTQITFNSIPIGGCTAIDLPAQTKDEVEVTSHDSQGWREFTPGLRDGGTVSLTCRLKPNDVGQQALWANFNSNNETGTVVITLPLDPEDVTSPPLAQVTFTFSAYVSETGGSAPFDDAGEATFTLRIEREVTRSDVSV